MQRPTLPLALFSLLFGCDKAGEPSKVKDPIAETPKAAATRQAGSAQSDAQTAETTEAPTRIITKEFSAPIPEGYVLASNERTVQLGQQFGQKVEALLTRAGSLRESIFIARLTAKLDPTNTTECRALAKEMTRVTGAKLAKKAKVVEYPFGETCEFAVGGGKQYTIQSIAYVENVYWTVTCKTSKERRKAGARECSELLRGFTQE